MEPQYIATPPWTRPDSTGVYNFGGGQIIGRTLPHNNFSPLDFRYKTLENPKSYFDSQQAGSPNLNNIDASIRYRQLGFDVHVYGRINITGPSNFLKVLFKLPIKPSPVVKWTGDFDPLPIGTATAYDVSTDTVFPGWAIMRNLEMLASAPSPATANKIRDPMVEFVFGAVTSSRVVKSAYIDDGGILAFEPFDWTIGDRIYFDLHYEAEKEK